VENEVVVLFKMIQYYPHYPKNRLAFQALKILVPDLGENIRPELLALDQDLEEALLRNEPQLQVVDDAINRLIVRD